MDVHKNHLFPNMLAYFAHLLDGTPGAPVVSLLRIGLNSSEGPLKRINFLNRAAVAALVIGATMTSSPPSSPRPPRRNPQPRSRRSASNSSAKRWRRSATVHVQVQGLGEVWDPRDVAPDWSPIRSATGSSTRRWGGTSNPTNPGPRSRSITAAGTTIRSTAGSGSRAPNGPRHGSSGAARSSMSVGGHCRRRMRSDGPPPARLRLARPRPAAAVPRAEVIEEAWVFVPTERIVADEISKQFESSGPAWSRSTRRPVPSAGSSVAGPSR